MNDFATINDVSALWRPMTTEEAEKVEYLIPLVSDVIRYEGKKCGCDANEMAELDPSFSSVAKLVTVSVIKRYLNENDSLSQLSQMTQSAMGYSLTGTMAVAGGGVKLLNNELKQLGFKRQRYGVMDLYEY